MIMTRTVLESSGVASHAVANSTVDWTRLFSWNHWPHILLVLDPWLAAFMILAAWGGDLAILAVALLRLVLFAPAAIILFFKRRNHWGRSFGDRTAFGYYVVIWLVAGYMVPPGFYWSWVVEEPMLVADASKFMSVGMFLFSLTWIGAWIAGMKRREVLWLLAAGAVLVVHYLLGAHGPSSSEIASLALYRTSILGYLLAIHCIIVGMVVYRAALQHPATFEEGRQAEVQ